MIRSSDLQNRVVTSAPISDQQRLVVELVRQYVAVAHEMPSSGWLSRHLNISRQRAREHLLRCRDWI